MAKNKFLRTDGLVYSTDPTFRPETEGEPEETLAPAQQRLKVTLDTKHRAGKAVTLVTGFVGKPEDLEILGKSIKSLCGSGGSVKDGEVIVQGDHRAKVIQWLKGKGYRIL